MSVDLHAAREFAVEVVQRLDQAGHRALWAGGCVRDRLLDRAVSDYDVATSAAPEQVREVFGRRRTLAIGAAFGVITVVGDKRTGNVEVASFRSDGAYTDGRRPDSVVYSDPEQDAARRDFTINGLFFDPLRNQVIDYVGGQEDLRRRVIRAIGDADARIGEDKLRMVRAVRFATVLGFEVEPQTQAAVTRHAAQIDQVSVERIAVELRKTLAHPDRRIGVELLARTGLADAMLAEADLPSLLEPQRLAALDALGEAPFPAALAALFADFSHLHPAGGERRRQALAAAERLRLTNEESRQIGFLLDQIATIRNARRLPWPQLQRVLINRDAPLLVRFAEAIAAATGSGGEAAAFARAKLDLPKAVLNPAPLATGEDLKRLGIRPGPKFRPLLEGIRDAQLLGEITSRDEALALAARLANES